MAAEWSMVRYGQVDAVLCMFGEDFRKRRPSVMRDLGFQEPAVVGDVDEIREKFAVDGIDVLVCDVMGQVDEVAEVVRQVRHGLIGSNPFPIVVAVSPSSNVEVVRPLINTGIDDLVIKPANAEVVGERLAKLGRQRKCFVVTSDYIGPDRRSSPRADGMSVPLIDVPNPLVSKSEGHMDSENFRRLVETVSQEVNDLKVERDVFQLGYLVQHLGPNLKQKALDDDALVEVARFLDTTEDLGRRIETSKHAALGGIAGTLLPVARLLKRDPLNLPEHNLETLFKAVATLTNKVFPKGLDNAFPDSGKPKAPPSQGERIEYAKGAVIFLEGDAAADVYIIEDGEVELLKRIGNQDQLIAVLGKGQIFGEMGLIDDEPRSATARASRKSTLRVVSPQLFAHHMDRTPVFVRMLLSVLCQRLRVQTEAPEKRLDPGAE